VARRTLLQQLQNTNARCRGFQPGFMQILAFIRLSQWISPRGMLPGLPDGVLFPFSEIPLGNAGILTGTAPNIIRTGSNNGAAATQRQAYI